MTDCSERGSVFEVTGEYLAPTPNESLFGELATNVRFFSDQFFYIQGVS